MDKICNLCGFPLNEEGKCSVNHNLKRMCLNCGNCGTISENGEDKLVCTSSVNMQKAKDRALAAIKESIAGYELATIPEIDIKPVPLRKPTSKCDQWLLSEDIKDSIESYFTNE